VSAAILVVMPLLGIAKQRIGVRPGSAAVRGEGTENLACACLAATVLAGLLANIARGWRWLDPAIALGIAAVAVRRAARPRKARRARDRGRRRQVPGHGRSVL
jgi:divalent metal cation (Fe/Co/Zn/Cd) transporter